MPSHRRKYPRPAITPAGWAALDALQGGCCAICERDDVELFTDHSYPNRPDEGPAVSDL
jgi:hypothetical protein